MAEKCSCPNPGWCQRHQMIKIGRLYEICKMEDGLGEKYRKFWDEKVLKEKEEGISRDGPPPTVRDKGQKRKGCGCGARQPALPAQTAEITAEIMPTPDVKKK